MRSGRPFRTWRAFPAKKEHSRSQCRMEAPRRVRGMRGQPPFVLPPKDLPVGGTFQFQTFIQASSLEIWRKTILVLREGSGEEVGRPVFGLPPSEKNLPTVRTLRRRASARKKRWSRWLGSLPLRRNAARANSPATREVQAATRGKRCTRLLGYSITLSARVSSLGASSGRARMRAARR